MNNPAEMLAQAFAQYSAGQLGKAAELCEAVLQATHAMPDAWLLRGVLGRHLGNLPLSVQAYEKAIALKPDYREAWFNLAFDLAANGQTAKAKHAYEQTLRIQPDHPAAWNGLGHLCAKEGELLRGVNAMRQAMALSPTNLVFVQNLLNGLFDAGLLESAEQVLRYALALSPDDFQRHNQLLSVLPYVPKMDAAALRSEYRAWAEKHAAALTLIARQKTDPSPLRKLRVAYLSSSFCDDETGVFVLAPFEHHDRTQVEVFAYNDCMVPDSLTERFESFADHWIETSELSDEALCEQMVRDQIDILVDITGPASAKNRWLVLARKPAPLQLVWMGHQGTTALPSVDALIGDGYILQPENDALLTETPIRLPYGFACWQPPVWNITVGKSPQSTKGFITYGYLGPLAALSDEVVKVWASIIKETPRCRLVLRDRSLKDPRFAQRTIGRFVAHGVEEGQIELIDQLEGHQNRLETYNSIDIALDPFPRSDGEAVCEALWMGVPAVTLYGHTVGRNQAASHLAVAGFSSWVVTTHDEYIEKAKGLATNLSELVYLRGTLRSSVLISPLCQGAMFTRQLELQYRQLWQTVNQKR